MVRAPFIPRIADELDVSNFAEEFTGMAPTDSPAIVPTNVDKIFKGYSYIAPSILFTDNIISEDLFALSADNKPTLSNIIGARFKNSTFFLHYHMDLREQALGDGSFSICRRCVHKASGQEMAVKIVSRRVDCSQEINLLRACQGHPNIVRLHDVFYDEAHTYIVMELLKGGELLQRIRQQKQFTESEAARIWQKLVAGVQHVHCKGIVHRDLKPENLLFESADENAELKIVDFGFARLKPEPQKLLNTPCFTLQYAAPEVLKTVLVPKDGRYESGYDESCDLWSLGVILYTMLCGRAPFHSNSREGNTAAVMQRIKMGDFDFDGEAWKHVSSKAKNVIQGLLTVDPKKRLTIKEVINCSWLMSRNRESSFGFPSLMTPGILSIRSFPKATELAVKQTIDAFHMAAREGFRLQDVCNARLAQRRKAKRPSNDARSISTSSSFSSSSSGNSSMRTASKGEGSASWSSVGFTPRKMTSEDDNVFSFREARVQEYLSSLSEAESSSRDSFHKAQEKEESFSIKNSWGNRICDSLSSVIENQVTAAAAAARTQQDLSLPGPSNNESILLSPISLSTRSKRRQPYKMSLPSNPPGQDGEANCEHEDASSSATTHRKQDHQECSGTATEVFERPLTRARKRNMARVCEIQPHIQPTPKRRKNF